MSVYDCSGSVLRTGHSEIRVKSVNGGYLFNTGSSQKLQGCSGFGGGVAVDRHSGCGCTCETMLSVSSVHVVPCAECVAEFTGQRFTEK